MNNKKISYFAFRTIKTQKKETMDNTKILQIKTFILNQLKWVEDQINDKSDEFSIKDKKLLYLLLDYKRDCQIILRKIALFTFKKFNLKELIEEYNYFRFDKTSEIVNTIGKSKL